MLLLTMSRLRTGSAPGIPRQMGQTLVFGGAWKSVGHEQNTLDLLLISTCTSMPITASYSIANSSGDRGAAHVETSVLLIKMCRPKQRLFFKRTGHQLQAHGQASLCQAAGNRHSGQRG
ncbi:MAG: hypothetical protein BWY09_01844 [Candidatus Hydrogenedentes bacterium ADurb.Bin179]|nr:MAG: hypothetical protein BWY09_01844 [Candidatus Hydrogenedentes bacterium ADurb.Bin179]